MASKVPAVLVSGLSATLAHVVNQTLRVLTLLEISRALFLLGSFILCSCAAHAIALADLPIIFWQVHILCAYSIHVVTHNSHMDVHVQPLVDLDSA